MKVFISHSSENRDFAELAREALTAEGFEVPMDDNLPPGTAVEHAVRSLVNDADIMILLHSRHSFISEWVQFECVTFLARAKENPNLHVVPILLDDSTMPAHLTRYAVSDFRVPDRYSERLQRLAKDLRHHYFHDSVALPDSFPAPTVGGPKTSAELRRMEEMILKAVSGPVDDFKQKLEELFEVFQKQQYLLTPKAISMKEALALTEIWVLTTHLYNDTKDPEFQAAVEGNLKRGINYKYFVDRRNPLIVRRLPEYEKRFAKFSERYEFITLPAGLLMPFDELVLYDPLETGRIWGYAQMKYPVHGRDDDNLFLKLSGQHSIAIADSLKPLAYPTPSMKGAERAQKPNHHRATS